MTYLIEIDERDREFLLSLCDWAQRVTCGDRHNRAVSLRDRISEAEPLPPEKRVAGYKSTGSGV